MSYQKYLMKWVNKILLFYIEVCWLSGGHELNDISELKYKMLVRDVLHKILGNVT